jgi:hypothetical protein
MTVLAGCPSEVDLLSLLEERLTEPSLSECLEHVRHCARCTTTLETLAGQWSLVDQALAATAQAGVETAGLERRLAATPPQPAPRQPVLPAVPPEIPGFGPLELVSHGGMGVVYRGQDLALGRIVAIKFVSAGPVVSGSARGRMEREARLLARLADPHIVTIHGIGAFRDAPYLVMEWIDGPTLQERIAEGPLPAREAARIGRDLARAVAEAHALGIVHRDIKPPNVLLAGPASRPLAKLIDFGLARPDDDSPPLTHDDTVLGTPCFMAAEQTGLDPAAGVIGPATDIHGVGGVVFAMLTGHAPYEAATPLASMQRAARGDLAHRDQLSTVPLDLKTIVEKCLEPVAARRYRSASDLADDLDRYLQGRPVRARPISTLRQLGKWSRRNPLAALAGALAVAFLASGAAGLGYHLVQLEKAGREIARRASEAERASRRAEDAAARLTDAAVRRLLVRGRPLDPGDEAYLKKVRDEYLAWPLEPDPRRGLAVRAEGLRGVAELFIATSRYRDAIECLRAEAAAREQLADDPLPASLERQIDALQRICFCCERINDIPGAIAAARSALAVAHRLPTDDGEHRFVIAQLTGRIGCLLAMDGHADEAALLTAEAIVAMRQLCEERPDEPRWAEEELSLMHNAALVSQRSGRSKEEQDRWVQLVDLSAAAARRFPDSAARFAAGESRGLSSLARLAGEHAGWEQAVPWVERRWRLCRTFVQPGTPLSPMHDELIKTACQAVDVYGRIDRETAAAPLLEVARPVAEAVAAANPTSYDAASLLARLLHAHAAVLDASGKPGPAEATLAEEAEVLRPWAASATRGEEVSRRMTEAERLRARLRSGAVQDPAG